MNLLVSGRVPRGVRPRLRKLSTCSFLPSDASVGVRFVSRRTMVRFNHAYRGKREPTDVLSFPYDPPPRSQEIAEDRDYLGDVVVCSDVVFADSASRRVPLEQYLIRVVAHGILHLLGYDHENEADAAKMRRLENQLARSAFGA